MPRIKTSSSQHTEEFSPIRKETFVYLKSKKQSNLQCTSPLVETSKYCLYRALKATKANAPLNWRVSGLKRLMIPFLQLLWPSPQLPTIFPVESFDSISLMRSLLEVSILEVFSLSEIVQCQRGWLYCNPSSKVCSNADMFQLWEPCFV